LSDYKAYGDLKKLIRDFKPDIVHTHAAKPGAIGRLAASAMKVPVIVHTFHGHVFHSYFSSVKTRIFTSIPNATSPASPAPLLPSPNSKKKNSVHQFRIAPEEKFRVIPLGLDLDAFATAQDEKRKKFRTSSGWKMMKLPSALLAAWCP
jgi:UDP-N-acetylglucosamine:LPS N-acetylglucosamine transferase